jgi:hypothetical protein
MLIVVRATRDLNPVLIAQEITTRFKTLPRGSVKTQINRNNPWRLIQVFVNVNIQFVFCNRLDSKYRQLLEVIASVFGGTTV